MPVLAAAGPTAYWYLTRGTGLVALVLLTFSVALGVASIRRVRTAETPRFVFDAIHRTASLLAVAFTGVHIATSLLDGYAPIRVLDVIIPFTAVYRPLWVGFGAVAFDLLIAVAITSVLRRRFGYRTWRVTHWAAYASWPVALLHGLGTGSDTKVGWALAIMAGCTIVMIVAVVARATAGWPERIGARLAALGAAALVPLGLLVWLPSGPLAAGWAKRAGTPSYLLTASSGGAVAGAGGAAAGASGTGGSGTSSPAGGALPSFTANVTGTVHQGQVGGQAVVDISLAIAGQQPNQLHIQISGQPLDGGGVQMTSSEVTLGTNSNPAQYRGKVTGLEGANVAAVLRGAGAGAGAIQLLTRLEIGSGSGSVGGSVTVSPTR
jgi:sulfoxide reductase heme-binding subunit YedZ